MDINCTHKCMYQHEGKCTLQSLPAQTTQSTYSQTDCPYYATPNASAMPR
ncbi:MAG: hypothetical protein FWB80_13285 [Defluviitaleaceae bacterium]|nr:hypothetical protein [Defluviitaleaceae bacterium]